VVQLIVAMEGIGGQAVVQFVVAMQGIGGGGRLLCSLLWQCKELGWGAGYGAVCCVNDRN